MSTAAGANNFYFRRRTMGRAASPPTWACYEQIHDDYSDSDSCSEDDDDYNDDSRERDSDEERSPTSPDPRSPTDSDDMDMDLEDDGSAGVNRKDTEADKPKDIKGKQRAIEPEPESPRQQRKKRQHVYTLRPILTIQKSQGFVWNQDLFVPPYIKDRYIASTSPPNSRGFIPSSVSSNSSTDYEVEVVEIRVREGEIYDIIP